MGYDPEPRPYAFVPFREIKNPGMRHVDVIGLINSIEDQNSDNYGVPYKRVSLQDEEGTGVVLLLWRYDATNSETNFWSPGNFSTNSVLAF